MPRILAIETAVNVCSVCIFDENGIIAISEDHGKNNHSVLINKFIEHVLQKSNLTFQTLDAVAVSAGPGSFTGLRIGIATAKGICYASNLPLIAVYTLDSMAFLLKQYTIQQNIPSDEILLLPMIDARRMEVYAAGYDIELNNKLPVDAYIIDTMFAQNLPENKTVVIGGNGAFKSYGVLSQFRNIVHISENIHSATGMVETALKKFQLSSFENIAYFEPFYLKEFIPGKPKVKGLE